MIPTKIITRFLLLDGEKLICDFCGIFLDHTVDVYLLIKEYEDTVDATIRCETCIKIEENEQAEKGR